MDSSAPHRASMGKPFIALVIVALVALVFIIEAQRQQAENQLKQISVQADQTAGGNAKQNAEEAKQIVDKVKKLIMINDTVQPTVATIVKVEDLRKINAFYKNAENGDNLVITTERAYLYRPSTNMLVDVVPVQIQQPLPEAQSSAAGKATSAAASK